MDLLSCSRPRKAVVLSAQQQEIAVQTLATRRLTAGNVGDGTVNRGHPQVGRAGVEHHSEGLRGGPQTNLTIILGLKKT